MRVSLIRNPEWTTQSRPNQAEMSLVLVCSKSAFIDGQQTVEALFTPLLPPQSHEKKLPLTEANLEQNQNPHGRTLWLMSPWANSSHLFFH